MWKEHTVLSIIFTLYQTRRCVFMNERFPFFLKTHQHHLKSWGVMNNYLTRKFSHGDFWTSYSYKTSHDVELSQTHNWKQTVNLFIPQVSSHKNQEEWLTASAPVKPFEEAPGSAAVWAHSTKRFFPHCFWCCGNSHSGRTGEVRCCVYGNSAACWHFGAETGCDSQNPPVWSTVAEDQVHTLCDFYTLKKHHWFPWRLESRRISQKTLTQGPEMWLTLWSYGCCVKQRWIYFPPGFTKTSNRDKKEASLFKCANTIVAEWQSTRLHSAFSTYVSKNNFPRRFYY